MTITMRNTLSLTKDHILGFFRFPTDSPNMGANIEATKLLWLIRLRWLAVILFFVLTVPALASGLLLRERVLAYLGTIGLLLTFNLATQFLLAKNRIPVSSLLVCFQLAFDLVILTVLLALTGGVNNPFISLFFLNAGLGGLLVTHRLSGPFVLLTHTLLALLQFQLLPITGAGEFLPSGANVLATFSAQHLLVFSFWLVMRSFGAHLERQFERQTRAQMLLEKQDRLRAVGALAAGFSHEFASPLNAAKIRLERIARQNPSEDIVEALDAVHACENVVRQMNSSQLDQRDFRFKEVIVKNLLEDIVETWRNENPEVKVSLSLEDDSPGLIPPINFAQVILNLLDNARQADPQGEIEVTLSGSRTQFSLKIKDQGPGFHESVIGRLGEPFVTTKIDGTGLGLYVSQIFCQSLGGSLSIENKNGASVHLQWPKSEEASA